MKWGLWHVFALMPDRSERNLGPQGVIFQVNMSEGIITKCRVAVLVITLFADNTSIYGIVRKCCF